MNDIQALAMGGGTCKQRVLETRFEIPGEAPNMSGGRELFTFLVSWSKVGWCVNRQANFLEKVLFRPEGLTFGFSLTSASGSPHCTLSSGFSFELGY